ncbi:hypothetical protein B0J12DRAFT_529137, partial [Macrophomina phaseolina]
MIALQHNCRKMHATTMAAIETALERQAKIVCLQEPCIGQTNEISHPGFQIRWPERVERTERRVLVAFSKDILNSIVIEDRTDLIKDPNIQCFDIWGNNRTRRTQILN